MKIYLRFIVYRRVYVYISFIYKNVIKKKLSNKSGLLHRQRCYTLYIIFFKNVKKKKTLYDHGRYRKLKPHSFNVELKLRHYNKKKSKLDSTHNDEKLWKGKSLPKQNWFFFLLLISYDVYSCIVHWFIYIRVYSEIFNILCVINCVLWTIVFPIFSLEIKNHIRWQ